MFKTPQSQYLLISMALIFVVIAVLSLFMLADALPYTSWPYQHFPIPTPSPIPWYEAQ